ncbi:hypothetical protein K8352_06465 [Flavobacteriaceae bacterium F89]|uniref:SHOCT domain-containing protein n=1 Tax=Cerina litoralis TaxID=2874477 RepID=A0AAE3EU95_9FLAO|nr:hypothetical protein [Cerina litoralis]MCG2460384.1 hypothetical protein [Cerina litoralis]
MNIRKLYLLNTVLFLVTINISVGQKATYDDVITKKVKGKVDTYISKSGEEFKEGDTITLGSAFRNEQFDYIQQNAGVALYPLPNIASGSVVTIKKISIRSKTTVVATTRPQGYVYGLKIINLEGALGNGEIKSRILSSDEALEELKKWKSKLDLELITPEEYETKKKELAKIIN